MGFIWEYFEEKNLLIDSLPKGFKYRVKKLKIIEKSDVKEEVKFQTQIQVNICDKDEAEKFIQMIKNKNDTEMKPTRKEFQRKGFRSQRFNCSRNVSSRGKQQIVKQTFPTNCMNAAKMRT